MEPDDRTHEPDDGAHEPHTEPQTEPHTEPQTEPQPLAAGAAPRRWVRSREDRVIGGVCGGIARALGVDPLIVRVAAVGSVFLAGLGLFLYLGAMLLLPDEEGETIASTDSTSGRLWTALGVLALVAAAGVLLSGAVLGAIGVFIPLAAIALAGLLVWWLVSGEGLAGDGRSIARRALLGIVVLIGCAGLFAAGIWATGVGSGGVAAGLVIAAGVAVLAGAFLRPVRWLVPLALSLGIGVGIASAADLDLHGGAGERIYHPASAAALRSGYEVGAGRVVVDLRGADLPAGDVPLNVRVGMGEALVIVPRDVCVASTARVGIGAVDVLGRETGGLDVDWEDAPTARAGRTRLVVDGDVGMGAFRVGYQDDGEYGRSGRFDGGEWDAAGKGDRLTAARACATPGVAGA
jgi:phage shock protein PspC (stress-responsive transcriptional regulator)